RLRRRSSFHHNANGLDHIPVAIVDSRVIQLEEGTKEVQVLVKWERSSREEATWVNWEELSKMFPHVDLEDKVFFARGIVETSWAVLLRWKLRYQKLDRSS
ncbi:hypothetical protein PIB30_108188, partial [Stylosanthes scabra]|nr:hypothetical protein [Stylosanthes scabra]